MFFCNYSAATQQPLSSQSAATQELLSCHSAVNQQPLSSHTVVSQQPLGSHSAATQLPLSSQSAATQQPHSSLSAASQQPLSSHSTATQQPLSSQSAVPQHWWIYGENISSCATNTWEIFDHRSLLQIFFVDICQTKLPRTSGVLFSAPTQQEGVYFIIVLWADCLLIVRIELK